MVIPGLERTISSACLPRVPEPRGRPRRPVPARCSSSAVRRGGPAGVGGFHTLQRLHRRLEAVVLLHLGLQFLHTRADLAALFIEKVGHD